MNCKSCGATVSENEERCPYCDSPIPRSVVEEYEGEESYEDTEENEAYQISEEELETKINERVEAELAEFATKADTEEGLSVFSWIGGVVWCIIGFCCGVLPGLGVIFLLGAAHEGPGFWRSFLRVLNVILYAAVILIFIGAIAESA